MATLILSHQDEQYNAMLEILFFKILFFLYRCFEWTPPPPTTTTRPNYIKQTGHARGLGLGGGWGEYPLSPHKYTEKGRGWVGRIRENLCAPLFYNSAQTAKTFATAKREISHNCVKSVYILVKVDIEKVVDIAS